MNTNSAFLKSIACLFFLLFFFCCSDDKKTIPSTPETPQANALTQKVNKFIYENFLYNYLWNKEVATDIDIRYETDPHNLFNKLIYRDDRWSTLTDNATELDESFEGNSTTFGYGLNVYKFSNSPSCYAIITYVYDGTPAQTAGLKRGDILLQINGKDIDTKNYTDLWYASSLELKLGVLDQNTIHPGNKTVHLTAVKMYQNPIITHKIIEKNNQKIGYLCYSDYLLQSHDQLAEIFAEFKQANVKDIVLDLRYNGGGYAETARYLSSILAPASALSNRSVYLQEIWNDNYMTYFKQQGEDTKQYFNAEVPVNMDLKRLFVLTSRSTASASEATMTGLSPYLELVQIGDTTHGKYCGGVLISPTTADNKPDASISNWEMYLMIYRFANNQGVTDFKNGFAPTYRIEETLENIIAHQLGDEKEILLAKALEVITGTPASEPVSRYRTFPLAQDKLIDCSPNPWQNKFIDQKAINKIK